MVARLRPTQSRAPKLKGMKRLGRLLVGASPSADQPSGLGLGRSPGSCCARGSGGSALFEPAGDEPAGLANSASASAQRSCPPVAPCQQQGTVCSGVLCFLAPVKL